ncbi:MAG: S1C family serine protease [Clostridium sp.]
MKHNDNDFLLVDNNEGFTNDFNNDFNSIAPKKRKKKIRKFIVIPFTVLISFTSGFLFNEFMPKNNKAKDEKLSQIVDDDKSTPSIPDEKTPPSTDVPETKKENMSVEDVVKLVSPGVVTISVSSGYSNQQGVGTGFIVNKDGTIITNYHVIEGATNIKITFNDGKEASASIIASSPKDDLAVLKVNENIEMPGVCKIAEHDNVNAGQDIIAIGNPLGKEFSGTVTKGIVSSPSRNLEIDGVVKDFIQIDAPINPGNSGGPLINLQGEIIGVNTAKKTGDSIEGIGFSVPIKYVRNILNNLDSYKANTQTPNTPNFNSENPNYSQGGNNYNNNKFQLGIQVMDGQDGPIVMSVLPNGYGEQAGLKANDIIIGVNNTRISSSNDLRAVLNTVENNSTLTLTVIRNNKQITLKLKL